MLLTAKGFDGFTLSVGQFPLWIFILMLGKCMSKITMVKLRNNFNRNSQPLLLGAGASVILWLTTSPCRPPPGWFQFILMVCAFVMSIAWLQLIPNEVVAVTESLGYTFNITTGKTTCRRS